MKDNIFHKAIKFIVCGEATMSVGQTINLI